MSCAARPNQPLLVGVEHVAVLQEIAEQRRQVVDLDVAVAYRPAAKPTVPRRRVSVST